MLLLMAARGTNRYEADRGATIIRVFAMSTKLFAEIDAFAVGSSKIEMEQKEC